MPLQIVFHGINRSPAVETAIQKEVEGLKRFDNQLGPCKVTVTQEGHQTIGAFTVQVTLTASGHEVVVSRSNMDVMAAINEVFDVVRRSVKEEADKRRHH